MNGNVKGSIYQDLATTPGIAYQLQFAYSDNPLEGGTSTADVKVVDLTSTGTLLSSTVSHSTSTNSPPFADWLIYTNVFVATGSTSRLSFTSTSASNSPSGGILLDAISVTEAIPEPTSLVNVIAIVVCSSVRFRGWRAR